MRRASEHLPKKTLKTCIKDINYDIKVADEFYLRPYAQMLCVFWGQISWTFAISLFLRMKIWVIGKG